jgi:N-dimethylarginine dimethylaminohydrolase
MMNVPNGFSAHQANNIYMEHMSHENRLVNFNQSMEEWHALYKFIVGIGGGLVHLMPTDINSNLQDLVFCANSGIVLHHWNNKDSVIISNFTSPPRHGETLVIEKTLKAMGYETVICPYKFEGEADLKYLYGNVYIGGYGIRSEKESFEWMEKNFGMKIIKIHMKNPFFYHLDCSLFPITKDNVILCAEEYSTEEIKEIENHINIIDVKRDAIRAGITNCVRVNQYILNTATTFPPGGISKEENDKLEHYKTEILEKICSELGLQPHLFKLSEFEKGGGLLSCLIMHLNHSW